MSTTKNVVAEKLAFNGFGAFLGLGRVTAIVVPSLVKDFRCFKIGCVHFVEFPAAIIKYLLPILLPRNKHKCCHPRLRRKPTIPELGDPINSFKEVYNPCKIRVALVDGSAVVART